MILIQLSGGLGNQMFQYAFAKTLQLSHKNYEVCLDTSDFENGYRKFALHHFNITLPLITTDEKKRFLQQKTFFNKIIDKFLPYYKRFYVEEKYYHFDVNLLKVSKNCFIKGYFQSEKYFKTYEADIRKEFHFKENPKGRNEQMLEIIRSTPNAVSIHIRRGDFVNHPLHALQDKDFPMKAIAMIKSKIDNFHLFVFSNDMPWVQQNLNFDIPFTIVDINNEENGFEDLRLMSSCKHHIIANSSFSWWGAWLNPNPNKIVIAPKKWVNSQAEYYKNLEDIIPQNWIKI